MSAVAEPLTAEARLEVAMKALSYYANPENYEPECDGETPVPGTAEVDYDRGSRARKALKELR